ncbi:hypothetical protein [uncultured Hymenobacter sp.]|uniref:hypothetical protein n=1 Tax=uncultured Hymenobacter sp. TaxID=170016 RepID=UPI0035CC4D2D
MEPSLLPRPGRGGPGRPFPRRGLRQASGFYRLARPQAYPVPVRRAKVVCASQRTGPPPALRQQAAGLASKWLLAGTEWLIGADIVATLRFLGDLYL